MKTILHHFAYNIRPNTLEDVLELFELFDCSLAYREGKARWCLIEQKPMPIDIQIIEVDEKALNTEKKVNTHIAFISNSPQDELKKVRAWAETKDINIIEGAWSDKELWFDLPDLFVNFVIEIMHSSVVEPG